MKLPMIVALAGIATGAMSVPVIAETLNVTTTAAGAPLAGADVSLWQASNGAPVQVAVGTTDAQGTIALDTGDAEGFIYVRAAKDKTTLMTALGKAPSGTVAVNELTTIASVFTHAQFLDSGAISGPDVSLAIASGHVKNLADPATGVWGARLLDGINSTESETLSRMNTLGNLIATCAIAGKAADCDAFLNVAGNARSTLGAIEHIAQQPWENPGAIFEVHDKAYVAPTTANPQERKAGVTFVPYLLWSPKDFSMMIRIAGGGIFAAGRIGFDAEGHLWSGQNWMPGAQNGAIRGIGGGLVKLDTDGSPLSPPITGYTGMGVDGVGWGTLVTDTAVWLTSFSSTIGVYDLDGTPIGPEEGITLDGKVAQGQGLALTSDGTVWVANATAGNLLKFPGGDIMSGEVVEVEGLNGPFSISISADDVIYLTNSTGANLTQFPADDPGNAKQTLVGVSTRGLDIDSVGNVWVASVLDLDFPAPEFPDGELSIMKEFEVAYNDIVVNANRLPTGLVTLITPDGTKTDFRGPNHEVNGPWGLNLDGKDNVWVGNFLGRSVVYLCGATGNCPEGHEAGDVIHNFESGNIQSLTDASIDQAGNLWAANNWNVLDVVTERDPTRKNTTQGGGSGLVVIYGVASPIAWPRVGPVRPMLTQAAN